MASSTLLFIAGGVVCGLLLWIGVSLKSGTALALCAGGGLVVLVGSGVASFLLDRAQERQTLLSNAEQWLGVASRLGLHPRHEGPTSPPATPEWAKVMLDAPLVGVVAEQPVELTRVQISVADLPDWWLYSRTPLQPPFAGLDFEVLPREAAGRVSDALLGTGVQLPLTTLGPTYVVRGKDAAEAQRRLGLGGDPASDPLGPLAPLVAQGWKAKVSPETVELSRKTEEIEPALELAARAVAEAARRLRQVQ